VVLLLLHLVTATALYVYLRRQTVGLVAFAIALVFLLLGSASDNLFFAFQIGWSGATAAGAWALVLLLGRPPRWAWVTAALLVVAVATSGVGLFFLAAATAVVLLSRSRRRYLWVVVPAIAAYAVWYLAYGATSVRNLPELTDVFEFVRVGIAFAIGEVSGLGPEVGLILGFLFAIAALGSLALDESPRWGLIAASVGLLVGYALAGLARVHTGIDTATTSYYIYPAGFFVLMAVGSLLTGRSLDVPGRRLRVALVVGGLTVLAVAWNMERMAVLHQWYADRADQTRAAISLLMTYGNTPAIPGTRGMTVQAVTGDLLPTDDQDLIWIPGRAKLSEIIERRGSPLEDSLAPLAAREAPEVEDLLFARLIRDEFVLEPTGETAAGGSLSIEGSNAVQVSEADGCVAIVSEAAGGWVELRVEPGSGLHISSDTWDVAEFVPLLHGSGVDVGSFDAAVAHETSPDQAMRILIPDIGSDASMLIRYAPPVGGRTVICGES
jgi:hypothetical protein